MKPVWTVLLALSISFQSFAQCLNDRHNTTYSAGWVSCEPKPNPNNIRGDSHWIQYKFNELASIEQIQIWNFNNPISLGFDIKELAIDISDDGDTWTELGVFELSLASGQSVYEGDILAGIQSFKASYLLLTSLANHGGSCTGLSEVKFILSDQTTAVEDVLDPVKLRIFPNPFSETTHVELLGISSGGLKYQLIDILGRVLIRQELAQISGDFTFQIEGKYLETGNYFLRIDTEDGSAVKKISVIHP